MWALGRAGAGAAGLGVEGVDKGFPDLMAFKALR